MPVFQRIKGLTSEQARENLLKFGPNVIFKPAPISFFEIARHEVTEPMILLLFVVGFFYSIWGGLGDALTIFVIILLLVLAEVNNEFRAKKAISSLEKIAAPKTRVMRDGKVVEIDSAEVVPDDLLIFVSGTRVAADALIMRSAGLQVDESALTGESFPVEKSDGDLVSAGTVVTNGEGEARVTITGIGTRLGRISAAAKTVRPPRTALQLAMRDLSGRLVYVAVFFSVLIPLIGWFRGQQMKTMFLTGLSLAFATIPEELPIIITMVLGLGAYTLSKHNFLVKKIKAAETLGNATVIVTDKTGTITESRMEIVSVYPGDESSVINKALLSLSEFSLSPLDREIKERAHTLNLDDAGTAVVSRRDLGGGRKTHSVVRIINDRETLFLSGAPEEVFSACREVPSAAREELLNQAGKGRRVIAVASGEGRNEKELEFGGLIAFEDPAREGVKETIYRAAEAGIRTIMVTGDHPLTAGFIAREVGIRSEKILSGEELDRMDDARLRAEVKECSVFARTTPEHKYRIVQALQSNGEVVAVTGDGINDALALKAADIGIAMGIRGTDVAKEAAEVVLADDNFVTIGQGIFEGRKFFDNLLKGVKYYLSVKSALIMIFLLPVVIGIPMPFAPIQIILLELFMDLAASAGFVSEPKQKNIYTRLPRNPREAIFNSKTIADIFVKGVVLFVAVMIVYFFAMHSRMGTRETQSFAFSAWIFAHIFLALISRSDKDPVFSIGLFKNPAINLWMAAAVAFLLAGIYVPLIGDRLQLAVIPPVELLFIFLATALVVGSLEVRKIFFSTG
jgi:P-type Ca2+ transporter type 2C